MDALVPKRGKGTRPRQFRKFNDVKQGDSDRRSGVEMESSQGQGKGTDQRRIHEALEMIALLELLQKSGFSKH